jgi:hypothetical protein
VKSFSRRVEQESAPLRLFETQICGQAKEVTRTSAGLRERAQSTEGSSPLPTKEAAENRTRAEKPAHSEREGVHLCLEEDTRPELRKNREA